MSCAMRRREFLRQLGTGAAAVGTAGWLASGAEAAEDAATKATGPMPTLKDVPKRKLGRLDITVPPLSIGLAAMGHALYTPEKFEPVVNAAIDAGLTYVDVASNYDVAQERLGPVMAKRRKEVFLVGKVEVQAWKRDDTLRLIEKSLETMHGEYLDLCHIHNLGDFTFEQAVGKGGCLEGIREAQKRGLVKHVGVSGHKHVGRFVPVIETGEIDLVMVAMNFVDRHTYNFEQRVLPAARKQHMAIVGMKTLGGVTELWGGYRKGNPGELAAKHYDDAFRYSLGIPGITTLVVGIKSPHELRQAILAVRNYKPFDKQEQARVERQGKALAAKWGPRFGPV